MAKGDFPGKGRGRPSKAAVEARAAFLESVKPASAKMTDSELLAGIQERFTTFKELVEACGKGVIPSVTVPGAPGIGKSYTVVETLDALGIKYAHVHGGISAVELYTLGWHHKAKGNVIFIDDSDIVFRDEDTMNILKAMTDSGNRRLVSWRKQTKSLIEDNIDNDYDFKGSIIFASNYDFQRMVDERNSKFATHMEALISRTYYVDLLVHDRRALSLWINHVCIVGKMFAKEDVDEKTGKVMLEWLHENQSKLREYSLRTVHKLCGLSRIYKTEERWKAKALETLCR